MNSTRQRGFTLTELAVVMVIVGLLLGGSIVTLSAQHELRNRSETIELLRVANEAVVGFAIANGRLPCPALPSGTGVERFKPGTPECETADGFLPATSLGLSSRDAHGYLVDAWGNRVRYAVSTHIPAKNYQATDCAAADYKYCPVFTTQQALLGFGITDLKKDRTNNNPSGLDDNGLLRVCSGETCNSTESAIPAVIWSIGRDSLNNAPSSDAGEKLTYYYPSEGQHDDIMVWISQYTLFSRMRAASAL